VALVLDFRYERVPRGIFRGKACLMERVVKFQRAWGRCGASAPSRAIQPIVALEQPLGAEQTHAEIAPEGEGA
jgi:hypothetical protein